MPPSCLFDQDRDRLRESLQLAHRGLSPLLNSVFFFSRVYKRIPPLSSTIILFMEFALAHDERQCLPGFKYEVQLC